MGSQGGPSRDTWGGQNGIHKEAFQGTPREARTMLSIKGRGDTPLVLGGRQTEFTGLAAIGKGERVGHAQNVKEKLAYPSADNLAISSLDGYDLRAPRAGGKWA